MDYAYFDTSALIKRYVEELGRREVLELLRKSQCVISAVLPVEVRGALRRRVADGSLDAKRVPTILKRFAADRPYWTVIDVSSEVLAVAEALSAAHLMPALDSIHVASAKLVGDRIGFWDFSFISADAHQTKVAETLGLKTRHVAS
jgi:predicted nucleic acid-binding protein